MNRLTKNSRRGDGVRGTPSPATGVSAARKTSAPAAVAARKTSAPVPGVSHPAAVAARKTSAPVPGVSLPAAVDVHVSHAPSVIASPFGGWWTASSPSEGLYPPGGFTNFMRSNIDNQSNIPENFHFVGAATNQSTMSPIDIAEDDLVDDAVDDAGAEETEQLNTNEDFRTDRRLNWNVEEERRLANAWLRNSKDPVDGNSKKADRYWQDVTDEYNKNTENSRKRNRNQLKMRWDRVKKPLTDFHGCWVNAQRVWQSGMSDDQVTDKALEMYAGSHDGKAFTLVPMWKVVRREQKWAAYLNRMKKEQEKSAQGKPSAVVNLELDGEKRPIGQKKAKKEHNGKNKASDVLTDFNKNFEKFIEASTRNKEEREKMNEMQQSLADKKIEAAKITNEAAHEQTKCKMLESYTQLLLVPTNQLDADALAERKSALESMRLFLFPK